MIGRIAEMEQVLAAFDVSADAQRTVLVDGEPGIGKTTFLDRVASHAVAHGWLVLRCTGVDRQTAWGYGALHELLHPLLGDLDSLPPRQCGALLAAFGLGDEEASPDRLLLGLAVLGLIEDAAARRPVAIVVDDLQWVDRSSADVIAFLSRRIAHAPIALLAATRTTHLDDTADFAAERRVRLEPLSLEEAIALLDEAPGLGTFDRNRILAEASGNPLAIVEFSVALRDGNGDHGPLMHTPLPTTRRVERSYLDQASQLPVSSRRLLLLAAVAGSEMPLPTLLSAAESMGLGLEDLAPIEATGLIIVAGERIRFRHPLVRSSVYEAATAIERAAAHGALAPFADQNTAAWHRAAATPVPDDSVAADLAELAARARARGAEAEAAAALRRSASLTTDTQVRASRLIESAESAWRAGLTKETERAIRDADPLTTTPADRLRLELVRSNLIIADGSPQSTPITRLVDVADSCNDDDRGSSEVKLGLLVIAAYTVHNRQLCSIDRELTLDALRRVDLGRWDPVQQMVLALLDPPAHAGLRNALTGLVEPFSAHPPLLLGLAQAAQALQDLGAARIAWTAAAELTRANHNGGDECHALGGLAIAQLLDGDLDDAMSTAEQVRRMGVGLALPMIEASGNATMAAVLATRGDIVAARAAILQAETLNKTADVPQLTAGIAWARGRLALESGIPEDALEQISDVTAHEVFEQWAIGDLVEAALAAGRREAAETALDRVDARTAPLGDPRMAMLVSRSRALLAEYDADQLFETALAHGEVSRSPVELARTHAQYGSWLRAHRFPDRARQHLLTAWDPLVAAGMRPAADRVRKELKRVGVDMPFTEPAAEPARTALTPQERQVASLAAQGLTNKEIADRIYLSHRTVGTHLSNAYVKLGIHSRIQLADILIPGRAATGPRSGSPNDGVFTR